MERLTTENLVLRKAKVTDLNKIWKNVWNDEKIAETMLWEPTKEYEAAVDRLKELLNIKLIIMPILYA